MVSRRCSLKVCIVGSLCISSASAFVSRPSSAGGVPFALRQQLPSSAAPNVFFRRLGSTSSDSSQAVTGDASTEGKATSDPATTITVAVTRELGKNTKLETTLTSHPGLQMMGLNLNVIELPSIEHAEGEDLPKLVEILSDGDDSGGAIGAYDYVVITSPEAARVLASAIDESDMESTQTFNDSVQVAAVGKATGKALEKSGIDVDFVPSQATGETLAAELPAIEGAECTKIIYPASAKARNDIQEGLEARTNDADDVAIFDFTRLNTYDTVPATFTASQMSQVDDIEIACFGSPSAVNAWLQNMDVKYNLQDVDEEEKKKLGAQGNGNVLAACIGTTSARAVLESGRWNAMDIYYPKENPGVDTWADSIVQASGDVLERKFWS
mmetsp:Transcript_34300/g.100886  ORF Transcript_34300/g.100886 Transcript_34300/m.100886 type:complete len:384 (-) Transcript_34300:138-1289(-)